MHTPLNSDPNAYRCVNIIKGIPVSETPLTDAEVNSSALENKNHPHTDWVPAYFARSLELKLHQAEQAASDNADWFNLLVSDLSKLLSCEAKASAVIEAVRYWNVRADLE
jgi:hypothetical protein